MADAARTRSREEAAEKGEKEVISESITMTPDGRAEIAEAKLEEKDAQRDIVEHHRQEDREDRKP